VAQVFLPKGTRDLLPAQMNRRLAVIDIVRRVFARYGFEPVETPALERIETLTGKSGDEDEKLMFRILKRGEAGKRGEVDAGLRYDLTVPLARMIAMNPGLPMPFKRSQIQPCWRADRPQRGRYREFYQCDVDTVGTESLQADAECIAVVHDALNALGLTDHTIRLNHRGLLRALAAAVGAEQSEADLLVALDKLEKIGREGVAKELGARGFETSQISALWSHLDGAPIPGAETAEAELQTILALAKDLGVEQGRVKLDPTLARGQDYYTGAVFETVLNNSDFSGSISGGGRYDGLIGKFSGKQDVPAVGVSLGIEPIFMLMEELGLMPEQPTTTQVWVTVFSEQTQSASLQAATKLRAADICVQVSVRIGKLSKQFKEAHTRGVPWALIIGPDDIEAGQVVLKNMATGEQWSGPIETAIAKLG
jgi:histidyl-tRNA synthetase